MIVHIYAGGACVLSFHPETKGSGCIEKPITISRDSGDTVILQQEDQAICLPPESIKEFIKALNLHVTEVA